MKLLYISIWCTNFTQANTITLPSTENSIQHSDIKRLLTPVRFFSRFIWLLTCIGTTNRRQNRTVKQTDSCPDFLYNVLWKKFKSHNITSISIETLSLFRRFHIKYYYYLSYTQKKPLIQRWHVIFRFLLKGLVNLYFCYFSTLIKIIMPWTQNTFAVIFYLYQSLYYPS